MSTISKDRTAQLSRAFMFIEHAHEGTPRMRPNEDGSERSYVHHPLEVAMIFAEMEIFHRKRKAITPDPEYVANKIIKVVKRASQMDTDELKERVSVLAKQLDEKQFNTLLGLLCHDTIESSYNRDTANAEKNRLTRERRRQIHSINAEVEKVVVLLTDSRKLVDLKAKKIRQMELARNGAYAALKQYDILANMFDEDGIPDAKRSPQKKREALNHMHKFMCVAHAHGHIPLASKLAADRIYARSMDKLVYA